MHIFETSSRRHNHPDDLGGPVGSLKRAQEQNHIQLDKAQSLQLGVLCSLCLRELFFQECSGPKDWGLAAPEMRCDRTQTETQTSPSEGLRWTRPLERFIIHLSRATRPPPPWAWTQGPSGPGPPVAQMSPVRPRQEMKSAVSTHWNLHSFLNV